jgi:hypothetical protein
MPLHLLTLCDPKAKDEKKKRCYAMLYLSICISSRLSLHSNNLVNLPISDLLSDNNTLTIGTFLDF